MIKIILGPGTLLHKISISLLILSFAVYCAMLGKRIKL